MSDITFYTYPSCTSCRKTKAWLKAHNVDVDERHIFRQPPNEQELRHILTMTTEGVDEILAKRSQEYRELDMNIEELPLSELMQLLQEKPRLLRRPILMKDDQLVIGYNAAALRAISDKKEHISHVS
ncbi:Spx/MgsR family RNA polymerase-binding regulatory protein [Bacillus tianshenii]|nr:Spx/MgsR family RNA polymerase-binding regulatory protein [Bacillus tianshenii]